MQSDARPARAYEQGQTQRDHYHAPIFPIFPTIHSLTTKSKGPSDSPTDDGGLTGGDDGVWTCSSCPLPHAAERVGSDVAVATSSGGASGWFK